MATSATSGIAVPSGTGTLRYQSGKLSRFLLRDRTLGYLFLAPALLVILVLVIDANSSAEMWANPPSPDEP